MINAIILAAGYSRRMGIDKLTLKFNEKFLIEHVIDSVISYTFNEIVLVGRSEAILKLSLGKGIKTIFNCKAINGQSESIKLGITNSVEADGYMFFQGDQPFIDSETIKLLTKTFNEHTNSIIVPRYKNRRGSPVIFPKKFKNELLQLEGDNGGRTLLSKYEDEIIFVSLNNELYLLDIDTEEDYKNILNLYR